MDPFVAEIRIFPFSFPPLGWAFCNGQLLPITQNTALFSLVGTYYGGDGKSNFALPDMQGNAPMQPGQGPGLSQHELGEIGGSETVTLLQTEIPVHSHNMMAATAAANSKSPAGNVLSRATANVYMPPTGNPLVAMSPMAITPAGGGLPHNNMMPYLTLSFCIALQGVFPSRP